MPFQNRGLNKNQITRTYPKFEAVVREGEFVGLEYTGGGYFLSVQHSSLPGERVVCDKPSVSGNADGIDCGFVIFIENREAND